MIFIIVLFLLITTFTISNIFINKIPKKKGNKGKRGFNGPRGLFGEKGETGNKGRKGYKGAKGLKGKDVGIYGEQGKEGIRGMKGELGEKGDRGVKGDAGEKGPVGLNGLKGNKGQKGLKGEKGAPRAIPETDDLNLIANKNKCIKLYDTGADFYCPKNMAIFDIKTKKNDRYSLENDIENVTCCEVIVSDPINDSYFRLERIYTQLTLVLFNIKENAKGGGGGYLNNYTQDQRNKMVSNYFKIIDLVNRIKEQKVVREIPRKNLLKVIGNEKDVDFIKEYTENEVFKIKQRYGSITTYELYILHLMSRLIRRRERFMETPVDITNYADIAKALYEFPKNNIIELEKLNKITYFEEPNLSENIIREINDSIKSLEDVTISNSKFAPDMKCENIKFKSNEDKKCNSYIGLSKNLNNQFTYNKCTLDQELKTIDRDVDFNRIQNVSCKTGEKIIDYSNNLDKIWDFKIEDASSFWNSNGDQTIPESNIPESTFLDVSSGNNPTT